VFGVIIGQFSDFMSRVMKIRQYCRLTKITW